MTEQEKHTKRRTYLREYSRKWRERNPDKHAKIQAAYWQRRLQRQQLAFDETNLRKELKLCD